LLNLLITECLAKESEEPMANQINDSVVLNAFKENMGLKNESDLALLVGSTATKVELINRDEEALSIDERIAIILRVIGKDHLQNCIRINRVMNCPVCVPPGGRIFFRDSKIRDFHHEPVEKHQSFRLIDLISGISENFIKKAL